MSAIGGMIHWNEKNIDSRPIFAMSRAMLLRGGAHRDAYVHGSVALFQNHAPYDRKRRVITRRQGETSATIVFDGAPCLSLGAEDFLEPNYLPQNGETILEAYASFGTALSDLLCGDFALAIADEARGELYLARDPMGARPLFYLFENENFFFASEIKGLLRALPSSPCVDVAQLRSHWVSSYGMFGAEDLYQGVSALPAGCSAVLSRLGLRIFQASPSKPKSSDERIASLPVPSWYLPEEAELASMLWELLYLFDAPEFDYLMPSLLHELTWRKERGLPYEVKIQDPTLYMSLGYAHRRADRIGALKGIRLIPTPPEHFFAKDRDLRRAERPLRSLLGSTDTAALRYLLGEQWSAQITREKNTAKRIRMEGMAYQILLWEKHFSLSFV